MVNHAQMTAHRSTAALLTAVTGNRAIYPDNEPTINPESRIVTLSLGSECTLTFSNRGECCLAAPH